METSTTPSGSRLWSEKPLPPEDRRSPLKEVTFGDLYVFLWKLAVCFRAAISVALLSHEQMKLRRKQTASANFPARVVPILVSLGRTVMRRTN